MTKGWVGASWRVASACSVLLLGALHAVPAMAQFNYAGINLGATATSVVNGHAETATQSITQQGALTFDVRPTQKSPSIMSAYIASDIQSNGFVLAASSGAAVSNGPTLADMALAKANWNNPNYVPVTTSTATSSGTSSAGGSLTFSLSQDTTVSLKLSASGGRSFGSAADTFANRTMGSATASLSGMGVSESITWFSTPANVSKDLTLLAGTYTVQLWAQNQISPFSGEGHEYMSELIRVSVLATVPEVSTWVLLALGLVGMAGMTRYQRSGRA